jgi:hypothetical protein
VEKFKLLRVLHHRTPALPQVRNDLQRIDLAHRVEPVEGCKQVTRKLININIEE